MTAVPTPEGYPWRVFDIGALEFLVLALAALFIFGPDRLPDIARQAARGLRQVRNMAANARRELSRELGPEFEDLDIRDLNPRNFVRKHVLDGIDEDDLRFDKDLDLADDLRVDDDTRTKSSNGSAKADGADGADDSATTDDLDTVNGHQPGRTPDDDPAGDPAGDAADDTAGDQTATSDDERTTHDDTDEGSGDKELAPVAAATPPFDSEAT